MWRKKAGQLKQTDISLDECELTYFLVGRPLPIPPLSLFTSPIHFTFDTRSFRCCCENENHIPFQHLASSLTVQNSFNSLVSPFVFFSPLSSDKRTMKERKKNKKKKIHNDGKMKTNVIHTPFGGHKVILYGEREKTRPLKTERKREREQNKKNETQIAPRQTMK